MTYLYLLATLIAILDPLSLTAGCGRRGGGAYLYNSNSPIYDYHDPSYYRCRASKYRQEQKRTAAAQGTFRVGDTYRCEPEDCDSSF